MLNARNPAVNAPILRAGGSAQGTTSISVFTESSTKSPRNRHSARAHNAMGSFRQNCAGGARCTAQRDATPTHVAAVSGWQEGSTRKTAGTVVRCCRRIGGWTPCSAQASAGRTTGTHRRADTGRPPRLRAERNARDATLLSIRGRGGTPSTVRRSARYGLGATRRMDSPGWSSQSSSHNTNAARSASPTTGVRKARASTTTTTPARCAASSAVTAIRASVGSATTLPFYAPPRPTSNGTQRPPDPYAAAAGPGSG